MKCSRGGRICSRSRAASTDLNEQQLDAGNHQVVSLLVDFQTRLLLTLLAALALGLGLALFTMRRILRLEDQARLQYGEVAEARTQLKELSARLVQAQEEERRSLSRELHDEVGQALSAVLVELRNLSTGLSVRQRRTIAPACGNHQRPGGKHGARGSQHGASAAAVDVGRPGFDSRVEVASPGVSKSTSMNVNVDVSVAAELRFRRAAGRIQNLHLSRGPGSAA